MVAVCNFIRTLFSFKLLNYFLFYFIHAFTTMFYFIHAFTSFNNFDFKNLLHSRVHNNPIFLQYPKEESEIGSCGNERWESGLRHPQIWVNKPILKYLTHKIIKNYTEAI